MSYELLQRVKKHIIDDGGLLSTYTVRYFRWQDTDLQGAANVALFRTLGTEGEINRHVQFPDVSLFLMVGPQDVVTGSADMLGAVQYLRANPSTDGAFNMFPMGASASPTYLENGRAMFEVVIRTGATDQ